MAKKKNQIDSNAFKKVKEENMEGVVARFEMSNNIDDYVAFNTYYNLTQKLWMMILAMFLLGIGSVLAFANGKTQTGVIMAIFAPLFPLIMVALQRMGTRNALSRDGEFKITSHVYTMYDTYYIAYTKCGKRVAEHKIEYNQLRRICERKDRYYFYVNDRNAFVISKPCINYGTIESLNEVIKASAGKKFRGR